MTQRTRKIVHIDEDKCDGCEACVPACAEGAIQVIDGKARLAADNLCDGLGNCLGTCPKDAIRIEERPAEAFDEAAVRQRRAPAAAAGGCPGAMLRKLNAPPGQTAESQAAGTNGGGAPSRLGQWPVQLALLPESGEIWDGADVLLAADCAAFAVGDFHERLLAGKMLAIACPKLDDAAGYVEKLARILAANDVASITVAHMEVPCCAALGRIVEMALAKAGRRIPVTIVEVGVNGQVLETSPAPVDPE